jgi:hypothetical protein
VGVREVIVPSLHFGTGPLALHYFAFCLATAFGTLQLVAARYRHTSLQWGAGRVHQALMGALIAGGYIWFFTAEREIYIPGLAGSALTFLFAAGCLGAILLSAAGAVVRRQMQARRVGLLSYRP